MTNADTLNATVHPAVQSAGSRGRRHRPSRWAAVTAAETMSYVHRIRGESTLQAIELELVRCDKCWLALAAQHGQVCASALGAEHAAALLGQQLFGAALHAVARASGRQSPAGHWFAIGHAHPDTGNVNSSLRPAQACADQWKSHTAKEQA